MYLIESGDVLTDSQHNSKLDKTGDDSNTDDGTLMFVTKYIVAC